MPAEITGDTLRPDPSGRQVEPALGPRHNQNLYSAEFLCVLADHAHAEKWAQVPPPIGRHLSDDALHAPTLLAGALICLLAAGTATALWIAIGVGGAPPRDKADLAIIDVAQPTQAVADEELQVGERAVLPAGLALLSAHHDGLPAMNAMQVFLDAALMRARTPAKPRIMTTAQPAMYLLAPDAWPAEYETDLSPVVAWNSSIRSSRLPELEESPAAPPAPVRANMQYGHQGSGNEGSWPTFTSGSIRTASFAASVESPKRASDVTTSAQRAPEDSQSSDETNDQSNTADSSGSSASPSDQGESREARTGGQAGDAIGSDTRSKNKGAIGGKKGSANSSNESAGAKGDSESRAGNGNDDGSNSDHGIGGKGKSSNGNGDGGNSDQGSGDKGQSSNGNGDGGNGDQGSGGKGKSSNGNGNGNGDGGDSDQGSGGKGKSSNGNGDGDTGDQGSGDQGSSNGNGDKGGGHQGSGDKGKGDKGKGGKGSGGKGSGGKGSGGKGDGGKGGGRGKDS